MMEETVLSEKDIDPELWRLCEKEVANVRLRSSWYWRAWLWVVGAPYRAESERKAWIRNRKHQQIEAARLEAVAYWQKNDGCSACKAKANHARPCAVCQKPIPARELVRGRCRLCTARASAAQ